MLEGQNAIKASQSTFAARSISNTESTVITRTDSTITCCQGRASSCEEVDNPSDVVSTRVSTQTTLARSYFKQIGLYQRKKTGRTLVPSRSRYNGPSEEIISENDETFLTWTWLGYGIMWTRSRSYGKLLPSLSVFPVVSHFSEEINYTLKYGDTRSFQRLISCGKVHPFTRNALGYSLLHVSKFFFRWDRTIFLHKT